MPLTVEVVSALASALTSFSSFLTSALPVGLPPRFAGRIVPLTSDSEVAPPPLLPVPPHAASSIDPTAASAKLSRIDRMILHLHDPLPRLTHASPRVPISINV